MKLINEKIISIDTNAVFKKREDSYLNYDGIVVETEHQTIKAGISNENQCCEVWDGYVVTEDDVEDFIGATLIKIEYVDSCLKKEKAPELYEGDVMFINFETSKGTLQFVCYNEHNGYYAHEAVLIARDVNDSEYL